MSLTVTEFPGLGKKRNGLRVEEDRIRRRSLEALVSYLRFEPEIGPAECGYAVTQSLCRAPRGINSGLIASMKGAAAGALIGATVGWFVGRTAGRWETVEVDQITARNRAFSLGLRVRP